MTAPAPRRLQLGTSRIENLPVSARAVFADPSWFNLGEPPPAEHGTSPRGVRGVFGRGTTKQVYDAANYRGLHFLAWYYARGLHLPFRDGAFDFAHSEHFFEHLFMDDAFALMRDVHRVLKPGAVLRTSVPDADLRSYEPPEPVGFGSHAGRKGLALEWTHPSKHKSRWSIHNLPLLLGLAGFEPVPLAWCDADGVFHERAPRELPDAYAGCTDRDMIGRMDYLLRPRSLIVDAIRR